MPYSNYYPCTLNDCDRARQSSLYCTKHYQKYKKYGDPLGGPGKGGNQTKHELCTIEGCGKSHAALGLCQMHYRRNALYGDPNLKPGRDRTSNRRINQTGYVVVYDPENETSTANGFGLEHRLIMAAHLGRPLEAHEQVHHKNGIRYDNRIENLELWSTKQPPGQRIEDKIQYAVEILQQYAPEKLA